MCPAWAKSVTVRQLDFCDGAAMESCLEETDVIVHLAALNEIESEVDPVKALLVNSSYTLKLLRAAEKMGVKRFIYFSTAHVYGSSLIGRVAEDSVTRPVHPYAITHRVAEDFVLAANVRQGIHGLVLRLSNGYGVPADAAVNCWTLVVNDLCRQAVTGRSIALRSAGIQWRDFITLEDVSRAVDHFIKLPAPLCVDGLFNLGGGCSLRVIDMARLIAERCNRTLGFRPRITAPKPRADSVLQEFKYSIDKIISTGFELKKNINSEIDSTLLFCRNEFGKRTGKEFVG